MKYERKVTIVVTSKGWTTTVEYGGKTYTEKHIRTSKSSTECSEGDFEKTKLPESLTEPLDSFTFFDIMQAL